MLAMTVLGTPELCARRLSAVSAALKKAMFRLIFQN
jgi:hypothetical protein